MSRRLDPLHEEVAERLVERLEARRRLVLHAGLSSRHPQDCARTFPTALVYGGSLASVACRLPGSRAGVRTVHFVDTCEAQLQQARAALPAGLEAFYHHTVEQADLPLPAASVDLVLSSMGLHWFNELPAALAAARRVLRPDGLLLAALPGGQTLHELRVACALAEQEREGGVSARVSPLVHVRDAGSLLGQAGFSLPAVDVDTMTMQYGSVVDLVLHLRAMGESNAVTERRGTLRRDTALAAAAAYHALSAAAPEEGHVGTLHANATWCAPRWHCFTYWPWGLTAHPSPPGSCFFSPGGRPAPPRRVQRRGAPPRPL
jgi:NADH dehydrogenase [ubiquinone] 1 alpha subcomplex assembly factor 5